MENNLDIFICSHTDFKIYPKNNVYKIVHGKEHITVPLEQYIETETDLSSLEYSLAEGSRMYWLYKNYKLKKYIGICHYRKYFDFFENVPNIDELFKEHDIITTTPLTEKSLLDQYSEYHRKEDLIEICEIASQMYPEKSGAIKVNLFREF